LQVDFHDILSIVIFKSKHTSSRHIWITGAGSGTGKATAVALAPGNVVALSGRRVPELEATAELVERAGGSAIVVPLDVSDPAAVASAAVSIGRIDDLVLAAGANVRTRFWADQTMEEFQRIVATNLTGVVAAIDASLTGLRLSHGSVVVVSSFSAWGNSPHAGVSYAASKTALRAICRSLNEQEAASAVRACHLCPGEIDSELLQTRPTVPTDDARALMLAPEDVARAIRFVVEGPPNVRIDELVITPVR
jgi:NADP-dependent 3-hydroxy acid dehydrogenase YdfG